MLSAPLAEYQSIETLVENKSDREIGILSLMIIDQHIQECNDSSRKLRVLVRWVASGVGLIVIDTLAKEPNWAFLAPFKALFVPG